MANESDLGTRLPPVGEADADGETSQVQPRAHTVVHRGPLLEGNGASRFVSPGTRVDRFVVERALGQGGMGVVLLAHDPKLQRRVALKLLSLEASVAEDSQATARMFRQAQAMARVTHPNLVTIYEVGTVGEHVFLAMEYVSGVTLRRWIRKPRALEDVLRLFEQAGSALQAVHDAGLVHRDFKPANVMVTDDEVIKVLDLGIARKIREDNSEVSDGHGPELASVDAPSQSHGSDGSDAGSSVDLLASELTTEGQLVGTLAYMAPEQLAGGRSSPASDQFSFAVSLCEALIGWRPFEAANRRELLDAMRRGDRRPWPSDGRVPAKLQEVVDRALQLAPDARHASVGAFVQALRASLGVRGRLRELADRWQAEGRTTEALLLDPPLVAEAWSLLQQHPDVLTGAQAEFIRASRTQLSRRRLKRRAAITGVSALALAWGPTAWLLDRRSEQLARATSERIWARISTVRERVHEVFNRAEEEILLMYRQRRTWMPFVSRVLAVNPRTTPNFETRLIETLERVNDYFRPVVEDSPAISSLMLATSSGQEVLVFDDPDAERFTPPYRVYNRVVNETALGAAAFEVFWPRDASQKPHWDQLHLGQPDRRGQPWTGYAPQGRPWFENAATRSTTTVSWTRPYLFFVSKDAGITGSIGWREGSTQYVFGVDYMLMDITLSASQLGDPEFLAVVLTREGGIIGLPDDPRFTNASNVREFFAAVDEQRRRQLAEARRADAAAHLPVMADLDIPVLSQAAALAPADPGVFSFEFHGQILWAGRAPVGATEQGMQVLLVQRPAEAPNE